MTKLIRIKRSELKRLIKESIDKKYILNQPDYLRAAYKVAMNEWPKFLKQNKNLGHLEDIYDKSWAVPLRDFIESVLEKIRRLNNYSFDPDAESMISFALFDTYEPKIKKLFTVGEFEPGSASARHHAMAGVIENARVIDDAKVFDNGLVAGHTVVKDHAQIYNNAQVSGKEGSLVSNNAKIFGDAKVIGGKFKISDNAKIYDNARVGGKVEVSGNARVFSHSYVNGDESPLGGNVIITENARVYGNAKILASDNVIITGYARIGGQAEIRGGIWDGSEGEVTSGIWDSPEEFIAAKIKAKEGEKNKEQFYEIS